MAFRVITIPFKVNSECFHEEELSKFCLNKKINSYQAKFFSTGDKAYWTVFLEYEEVLAENKQNDNFTEPEKLLYKRFREWRKDIAQKSGVPVYIVATNGELISLIRKMPKNIESLKSVRGFGNKKIEKYGKDIIEIIRAFYPNP